LNIILCPFKNLFFFWHLLFRGLSSKLLRDLELWNSKW
jgi:hypothetical protein